MSIWSWIQSAIRLKSIIVPFSKVNCYTKKDNVYVGYSDYYIFGIRIARIQQTEPWTDI